MKVLALMAALAIHLAAQVILPPGIIPAGRVGGAANLSTPGALPFVLSPGTLTSDAANLSWDATNRRLAVSTGTASESAYLGYGATASVASMWLGVSPTTSNFSVSRNTSTTQLNSAATTSTLQFMQGGAERGRFGGTTGNFLVGGNTTDRNYKFQVNNSGSVGTASIVDNTATTGATLFDIGYDGTNTSATTTQLRVRAGAGQGGTSITLWTDSAGAGLSAISPTGSFIAGGVSAATATSGVSASNGVLLASGRAVSFYSGANLGTSIDTSILRNAAGILEINNGTAGTFRDLRLRNLIADITTPASSSATGTQGTIAWDASYIYIATATNTWKRVALSTF